MTLDSILQVIKHRLLMPVIIAGCLPYSLRADELKTVGGPTVADDLTVVEAGGPTEECEIPEMTESIDTVAALYAEVESVVLLKNRDSEVYAMSGYDLPAVAYSHGEPVPNLYFMPYSMTKSYKNWKRMWINTATLIGAYVAALGVLECLPADATAWNRDELTRVPLFKRWKTHVIDEGPEWDHDKFMFNYVLHPYAGAAYFMSARSCGFNFWQSLLYSTCISTFGWEFGIEAFMERPSIQDIFITPLVGSFVGECFYGIKRHIVQHGYTLWGSPVLGNIVAFICDPVNEVIGLIAGNPCRKDIRYLKERGFNLRSQPWCIKDRHGLGKAYGLSVSLVF